MKQFKKIIIFFFLFIFFSSSVFGKSVEEIQKEIETYQNELSRLGSQSKTLSNQIAQFDAQIKLTSLKITQTEEKILSLGGRIEQLESSIESLEKAFSQRVVETYKMSRFENNLYFLMASNNIDDAVSRFHYLKRIQEADRSLFERLTKAQTIYKVEKTDQESLQEELEKQKKNLDAQKIAKASLLSATKNDEKKYQSLLAQAKAQLAALSRFVASRGGASILSNQTKCNDWGCYYNQRDSLWGNIGLGGSSYSTAEYGCLVSSVSMMASHYGKNIKPNDIATSSNAFVPGTGYLYHSFSVNGINVSISTASRSVLDSELAAGKPVIAGLYSGPDHFIVILKKDGDKYIMHDPFLENGNERNLTDKYSVDAITSLRLISFN